MLSCVGQPEGPAAGNSGGELVGQFAGKLDGMLGNQTSGTGNLKAGELGGMSLGP